MSKLDNNPQYRLIEDPHTFVSNRNDVVSKSNEEMKRVVDEVVSNLLTDKRILYSLPFTATVFHTQEDRHGKVNNKFVNFGEYTIHDLEVEYFEGQISSYPRVTAVATLVCKYTSSLFPREGTISVALDSDFKRRLKDDQQSWGQNCFFLTTVEYISFKDIVTEICEELFGKEN